MISDDHPLQKLFMELVARHYAHEIGIRDPELVGYVSHLLTEFCDAEPLFKLQNTAGKPISDVGEMLLQADPVYGPAPSFEREREVRRHVGDYTLFWTGVYPEALAKLQGSLSADCLISYQQQGKRSYYVASTLSASATEYDR